MSIDTQKETPNERFRRLATARTNSILEKIALLGRLADRRNYHYTDDEVNKIFAALSTAIKETKAKFTTTQRNFKL